MGRPGADAVDAGHRGRWCSLGINTWAGQGRWAVLHGGIMNVRGRDSAGRPISGQIVSHPFRSTNGAAVFMAVPWTRDAQDSLDDLRRAIGETHTSSSRSARDAFVALASLPHATATGTIP